MPGKHIAHTTHGEDAFGVLDVELDGGADARYLGRRLLRMASEDIGLADPRALRMALDAADVYERLGTPEGELALRDLPSLAEAVRRGAIVDAKSLVAVAIAERLATR